MALYTVFMFDDSDADSEPFLGLLGACQTEADDAIAALSNVYSSSDFDESVTRAEVFDVDSNLLLSVSLEWSKA